jgi:ubiquinone/menaquinone biosynthesis C-methylase UbiE
MTFKSWIYDKFIASRYDKELQDITQEFRQICIDRANIEAGQTVLEIGCGTGLNQPMLAAAVGEQGKIIAIDASTEMLAQAKARADEQGYGERIEFIHGDLRELKGLVSATPDVVIATLIFSVVPDWRQVFADSFELLKAGGRYSIMDNYWPKPSFRLWLASWTFVADAKRPGFQPLEQATDDFVLEYHPPDADIQFYIAHGTKSA